MRSMLFLIFITSSLYAQDGRYNLDGQNLFVPKLGSKEALGSHPRLKGIITTLFNRPGEFHGPNCYNTSLIASGLWDNSKKRYVSPNEFEALLKSNFQKVYSPAHGDVIVYDAKKSRGHSALYLGSNLVFHKKSFGTQYHYRIVESDKVGVVEENEWTPGPADDSSMQMNWPLLGKTEKEYYKLKSKSLPRIDPRFEKLLLAMERALETDLKTWAIGRRWGMVGEHLLESILSYGRAEGVDKYTEGLILSIKDQVYVMIEEVYFRQARSTSKILKEICIPEEKTQVLNFIREFARLQKKDSRKVEEVIKALEEQDKSRCSLRVGALLSQ